MFTFQYKYPNINFLCTSIKPKRYKNQKNSNIFPNFRTYKSLSKTHPTAATEEDHTIHTTKPHLFTNPTLKTQELYIT